MTDPRFDGDEGETLAREEGPVSAPPISGIHQSALEMKPRVGLAQSLVIAVLLHVVVFGGAILLPMIFESPKPLRKPIIAKLVALGKPRDQKLLPRKESAPPPPATSAPAIGPVAPLAAPAPGKKPAPAPKLAAATPAKHAPPSRQELMERALAHAAGRAEPDDKPDDERPGQKTGSTAGTAESSEEGDAYFTAVHDAILENYVVPSVISERERLYLAATVVAFIGKDGQILKHELQKKSGNAFFDQALALAIQRTKLPPPPADLARSLRDDGVVLNFKP